ncbi:MAG: hypothetical protein WBC44_07845 [Planctomycetaceae bacterium]
MCRLLIPYWIEPGNPRGPLGFGVTAYSLGDAIEIIHKCGFGNWLPNDVSLVKVIENVRVDDLEHEHVRQHMGPIVVRGLWYPFSYFGPLDW